MKAKGNVLKNEEGFRKVVFAKGQAEYEDLAGLLSEDENAVLFRFEFSDEDLKRIEAGDSLFLEVLTFKNTLQPVMLFMDDPDEPEFARTRLANWKESLSNRSGS